MKYTTRPAEPVTIEAEQFPLEGEPDYSFGVIESFAGIENARSNRMGQFEIRDVANAVWLPVQPGDFVCRSDSHGYWTVRASIFEKVYMPEPKALTAEELIAAGTTKVPAKTPAKATQPRKATQARKPAAVKA